MKIKLLIVLLVFILVLPSFAQISRANSRAATLSKIKIKGGITYYGSNGSGYLSMLMNLTRNGRPVTDAKVLINNDPNTYNNNLGTGWIGGSIFHYNLQLGNKITISIVLKNKFSRNPLDRRRLTKKIVVATLKVSNIIEWVYPTPGQVIAMPPFGSSILFKWNFTGSPIRTELYIRDVATNNKIYSRMITNTESQRINPRILRKGKEYKMGFWSDVPHEYFKITRNVAPGSEVSFRFCNSMKFKTKK